MCGNCKYAKDTVARELMSGKVLEGNHNLFNCDSRGLSYSISGLDSCPDCDHRENYIREYSVGDWKEYKNGDKSLNT